MVTEKALNKFPSIFPLGDSAATMELGNRIDETLNGKVMAIRQWIEAHPFEGLLDCLAAYSSLTIIYDPVLIKRVYHPSTTVFDWVSQLLREAFDRSPVDVAYEPVLHRIPVCYEGVHAPDLQALAQLKQLTATTVVELHTATLYKVYMIGFLPGFPYLGTVNERIAIGRKMQPVPVLPGSVGIAGEQTGIYPLPSPGGWQIIGRTPVSLFNPYAAIPVPLKTGDQVQFYPISLAEFNDHH